MNTIYIVTEHRISGESKLAYPSWEKVCEYHPEAKALTRCRNAQVGFERKARGNHKPYVVTITEIDLISV